MSSKRVRYVDVWSAANLKVKDKIDRRRSLNLEDCWQFQVTLSYEWRHHLTVEEYGFVSFIADRTILCDVKQVPLEKVFAASEHGFYCLGGAVRDWGMPLDNAALYRLLLRLESKGLILVGDEGVSINLDWEPEARHV